MGKKFKPIHNIIINAMKERLPEVIGGEIGGKGGADVYLMVMPPSERLHAVHYLASPAFVEACKAADAGDFDKLKDCKLDLCAPASASQHDDDGDFKSKLSDDHLLVTHETTATFEDGTRRGFDLDVTVGMVRKYMSDPNRCQCDNCQRVFPAAMQMLLVQEQLLAGEITSRQMERRLKQLGYVRGEAIQHH
jgi:hypothetical protein